LVNDLSESWIMKGIPVSGILGEKHERRRGPILHYAKSPFSIEYNPWIPASETEDAMLYRGVIVSSFAQTETGLGELAIRVSRMPEYYSLRERFPFTSEKRIAFLRSAFLAAPLAPYHPYASRFLEKFEQTAPLRHMMAHGRMQVLGGLVTFHDIPWTDGFAITIRRQRFVLAGLELVALRSAKLARLGHLLNHRLEALKILPPLDDAE